MTDVSLLSEPSVEHLHSLLDIELVQYSDRGRKAENQDTVGARIPGAAHREMLTTKGIAIAIADGVSSSAAARQASQSAVTGFLTDYFATPDTWSTYKSATRVIHSLNRYLWGQSRNSVREGGFLTTFTVLILKGDKSFVFHVGDTRVYRLRGEQVELLTRDHSQRIDRTTTYLSRALGADPVLEIDSVADEIEVDDVFVLTSDGIHDVVPQGQFNELIREFHQQPERLVQAATQRALELGSTDNLSIQVARVRRLGTPTQSDSVTVLSQLPFPPLLEPGQTLDGLEIKQIMHESERSQIYLVRGADGKMCVMKTPSPRYNDDVAYIERFVMEAWIGSRIQNPQVIRVVQPPHPRSCLYYLTEHLPGPTLEQLIRERAPLPIPDAVELIEQIIKGVRAFHRKDTLHQDLRPANILVTARGAVLIDFGSCHVAGIQEMASAITRDQILGTLDYSAPEHRYGGPVGYTSDQFSLGVIFYEMITGEHPFGTAFGKASQQRDFQQLKYIPARRYNPLVPVWMDKAIEKTLNLTPRTRYEALSEWLRDLQRPNPDWLHPEELPFIQRDPVRAWKLLAIAGWLVAFLVFIVSNQ